MDSHISLTCQRSPDDTNTFICHQNKPPVKTFNIIIPTPSPQIEPFINEWEMTYTLPGVYWFPSRAMNTISSWIPKLESQLTSYKTVKGPASIAATEALNLTIPILRNLYTRGKGYKDAKISGVGTQIFSPYGQVVIPNTNQKGFTADAWREANDFINASITAYSTNPRKIDALLWTQTNANKLKSNMKLLEYACTETGRVHC